MPDRRVFVGDRRALEGNDPVEAVGWAEADQRVAAEHSGDDGTDADPASPGTRERWDHLPAGGEDDSAVRALLDFEVRRDHVAGVGADVRLGANPPGGWGTSCEIGRAEGGFGVGQVDILTDDECGGSLATGDWRSRVGVVTGTSAPTYPVLRTGWSTQIVAVTPLLCGDSGLVVP